MRERLIKELDGADLFLRNRAKAKPDPLTEYDIEVFEDIAKICDEAARTLERAIVPPCKVGDTVWYEMYGEIESAVIYFCRGDLTSRGFVITDAKAKSEHGLEVSFGEKSIGKKVFLTREEAELEWDTVKKSQSNLNRR